MKRILLIFSFCFLFLNLVAQSSYLSLGLRVYETKISSRKLELRYFDTDSTYLIRNKKVGNFPPMIGLNFGWDFDINPTLYVKAVDFGFCFNANRMQWYDYLGFGAKIPFGDKKNRWLKFQSSLGYHYNVFWFGDFAPDEYGWDINIDGNNYQDTINAKFKSHFFTFYPCLRVGAEIGDNIILEAEAGYQIQLYQDSYLTFKVDDANIWKIFQPFTKSRLDMEHVYDQNQKPLKTTPFKMTGWNVALRLLIELD